MFASPTGPSDQIKYGTGNLVVWNDGGWVIGEYNGTDYGTEGIHINPGIEGSSELYLPPDSAASTQSVSLGNYNGNVAIFAAGNTWTFNRNGNLTLPLNTSSINYANGSPYGSSGANTANIKPGRYVFDVITIDTFNTKNRVLEGTITVTPSVTK